MNRFIFLMLIVMSTTILAADRFTLVADGKGKAQIVTGEKAPETVRFAAKELQTFVKKMSGAELPIVAKAVKGTPSILLGPAARAKLPPKDLKGIKRDGYIITVNKGNLCIVGIDDAGPQTESVFFLTFPTTIRVITGSGSICPEKHTTITTSITLNWVGPTGKATL